MSIYGKLWEDLWDIRMKIDALTIPRGFERSLSAPESLTDARERVQKRKDELDKLLAEWVEIELRMKATGEP